MIPVILGILIALLINNWKENSDNQRFVKKVLDAVKNEMKESAEGLKQVMPRQQAVLDTLMRYQEDETVTFLNVIEKNNGFKAAFIQNTAWKAFLNTKIELIDYKTFSLLNRIDQAKQTLNIKLTNFFEFAYNHVDAQKNEKKATLEIFILDILDSEETLLGAYEEFLK